MSGAPVTNENGRLVGVHLSNTGFTGGGAVLRPSHVHEETEVERLRREIQALKDGVVLSPGKDPMDQSTFVFDGTEIVNLIREAVRREVEVLRHEVDLTCQDRLRQAKGKTKAKARLHKHKKRVRAFTEEEYKALQDKGYSREQLKDMAAVILERMNESIYDEDDYGYPEYDDITEEERREIERDWLGQDPEHDEYARDTYRQSYTVEKVSVENDYNPKTHPWDVHDKYSLSMYHVTEADEKLVGQALLDYDHFLVRWMSKNLRGNEWQSGIDIALELKELADARLRLEHAMVANGLVPFCQRKKKERKAKSIKPKNPPKNGKSPPVAEGKNVP